MLTSNEDFSFADAARIVRECFAHFEPPRRESVAEYALANRWLSNLGGGYVGRWTFDGTEYLRQPTEDLTNHDYQTIAVVAPAQSGKTSIAENWALHSVGCDPGNLLWYMQTEQAIEAYVKTRINPMIDAHKVVKDRLGSAPSDKALHYKRFANMHIEFLAATYNNLIGRSVPRIVVDEIDSYPVTLGDVKALIDPRRQTFGRSSKLLAISHADRATGIDPEKDWSAGIMSIYADSTRATWWWPCPHCGAFSSPVPTASRVMVLDYPRDKALDEIENEARLICPVNGCVIEDHERRGMNARGKWVYAGEDIGEDGIVTGQRTRRNTAGYWVVGVMSPFILGGIGSLARARAKAEREAALTGDETTLRQVMAKQWGIPHTQMRKTENVDATVIADRAEHDFTLGTVPHGVRFLTAAVDAQLNRFEVMVRGWGAHGESWVVDFYVTDAEPPTSAACWDMMIERLLNARYPLADGSGRVMTIRGFGYDSGGYPGTTQNAYDAWRRWKRRSRLRKLGRIEGRDAWNMIPLKGMPGLSAQRLSVVYPDSQRKDRSARAGGTVPMAQFHANSFKDDLAGQLSCADPGAWYVHFPAGLRSDEEPHTWFQQLVAEEKTKTGAWVKPHNGTRNEACDLMVMNHALAQLHGMTRINWNIPPAWAADWDRNVHVQMAVPTDAGAPPMPASTLPAPPVAPAPAVRVVTPTSTTSPGASRARRYA